MYDFILFWFFMLFFFLGGFFVRGLGMRGGFLFFSTYIYNGVG